MKKWLKSAQASMEFLVIFGFVFLMMVPLIIIFFDQTGTVEDAIAGNQLRNIAIKIADKAESVYYTGGTSKTTLKVYFPDGLTSFNITSRTIIFGYTTKKGVFQNIEAVSIVNITGNLSVTPGIHYIEIQSNGGLVSIGEE